MKTQGAKLDSPSHTLDLEKCKVLVSTMNKDVNFFLQSLKVPVRDFVSLDDSYSGITILLAVSGGVDSQVMLHCLFELNKKLNINIHVITVNHNLREASETKADAELVYSYCTKTLQVPCKIVTIEPNKINNLCKDRERGVEEAARYVRYMHIKEHATRINAQAVFFAHNKNDQLETLLQHFLQGASAGVSGYASSGIRQCLPYPYFDSFAEKKHSLQLFRPLLNVDRDCIEHYAKMHNVPYREDSTNSDTIYYRNKIRHKLVPVLNDFFSGWDTGVLNGSEKAFLESEFIESLAAKCTWDTTNGVKMRSNDFFLQGFPVRVRLLYRAFSLCGVDGRIPYEIVKAFCLGQRKVEGSGIHILRNADYISVSLLKDIKKHSSGYAIDIDEVGVYSTNIGIFEVKASMQKKDVCADIGSGEYYLGNFSLPITIRTKKPGDKILTAQGTHKSIKKIFSEWRVDVLHRNIIPLLEKDGELQYICGAPFGFSNWYVKEKKCEQEKSVTVRFIRKCDEQQ